jgi:DNA-binding XRE family transcriptional regulator
MALRSLPLTDKSRPGGRPRKTRAPHNAFAAWLATCGMTPTEVAEKLKLSVSAIYNARNGYFKPGREVANHIATFTGGAVSAASWDQSRGRPRDGAKKPRKRAA